MRFKWVFVVLLLIFSQQCTSNQLFTNKNELNSLIHFARDCGVNGSFSIFRSWCIGIWITSECDEEYLTDPCTGIIYNLPISTYMEPWEGIECIQVKSELRIRSLNIQETQLSCTFEEINLGELQYLEELDLASNYLTGTFSLNGVPYKSLQILNLSHNSILGEIPVSIVHFKSLTIIDVSNNRLNGSIPLGMENLHGLRVFDGSYNNFDGDLSMFNYLPEIEIFSVNSNNFYGVLPWNMTSWGRGPFGILSSPSTTRILNFSNNKFVGSIPHCVSNMSRLEYFNVRQNKLTGYIPELPASLKNSFSWRNFEGMRHRFWCPFPKSLHTSGWGSIECHCPTGTIESLKEDGMCEVCPSGTSSNSTHCLPCPYGFVRPALVNTTCEICPAGTYKSKNDSSECINCPANTYSDKDGSDHCTPCPRFKVSEERSVKCGECPPGKSISLHLNHTCIPCASGTYSTDGSSCKPCSPGTYSNKGFKNCITCPKGQYSSKHGGSTCSFCPPGSFAEFRGQTICQECPLHTFQKNLGSSSCEKCPPQLFTKTTGSTECHPCPTGTHFDKNHNTCIPCPPGTYSNASGSTGCISCGEGKIAPGFGNAVCSDPLPPGMEIASQGSPLSSCRPGTYNNGTQFYCQRCEPGKYAFDSGSTYCKECEQGFFSNISGLTRCYPARPGFYVEHVHAKFSLPCPKGQYSSVPGSRNCKTCPHNTFASFPGTRKCKGPGLGSIMRNISFPVLEMRFMGENSVMESESIVETALRASVGKYTEPSLVRVVTMNEEDFENEKGTIIQFVVLSMESYQSIELNNEIRSSDLPRTIKSELIKLNLFPREITLSKSHGTIFSTSVSVPCPTGEYYDSTIKSCKLCPIGTYTSSRGSLQCKMCPKGTFSNILGASICTNCKFLEYSEEGESGCHECPVFHLKLMDKQCGAARRTAMSIYIIAFIIVLWRIFRIRKKKQRYLNSPSSSFVHTAKTNIVRINRKKYNLKKDRKKNSDTDIKIHKIGKSL